MEDIKQLLTDFNLDPENEKVNAFFERENIWKILDIQRYELSHSAFLSWFFKQNVAQYSPLKYFLNLLAPKVPEGPLIDAILTGSYTINSVSVAP